MARMPSARQMMLRASILLVLLVIGLAVGATAGLIALLIGAGLAIFWLLHDGPPIARRRRRRR